MVSVGGGVAPRSARIAADPMPCSVAMKLWLITSPRWCATTYFSAVTTWDMLTPPAVVPPGVSASTRVAPGAIVWAYSTSSVVSVRSNVRRSLAIVGEP